MTGSEHDPQGPPDAPPGPNAAASTGSTAAPTAGSTVAATAGPTVAASAPRGKASLRPRPAIQCRNLTKQYGSTTAVGGLTLSVDRGEIFGLLGPNGAGKTTTILMLLGLTEPTSGTVRVLGLDPARDALGVKSRVGYLPDAVGFYTSMTARQNLRYTARLNGLRGAEAESRIDDVLHLVGLTSRANDRVGAYSRGMGQRLGIADALIKRPDVLILDEPTVGLDPRAADQVLETISGLASDQNVTVLLSSHLLTQVQAVCHRIGIFVRGSLVAAGTIDDLAASHGGRISIEVAVRGGDAAEVLRRIRGVVDVQPESFGGVAGYLVGAQSDVRQEISRALGQAGFVTIHLRQRPEELGRIYRQYFSEADHDAA